VEEEVLALMVRGLKDRQIAEAMGLSYETVRNYVLSTLKEASCGLGISTNGGTSFTNYTTTNGLVNNHVNGVYASGSNIYAATYGGLSFAQQSDPNPVPAPLPVLVPPQLSGSVAASAAAASACVMPLPPGSPDALRSVGPCPPARRCSGSACAAGAGQWLLPPGYRQHHLVAPPG
jgi:hypothetical protein